MELLQKICFGIIACIFAYYAYVKIHEFFLFRNYKDSRCCRKCGSIQKYVKMNFSGVSYWISTLNLKKDCVCHSYLDKD